MEEHEIERPDWLTEEMERRGWEALDKTHIALAVADVEDREGAKVLLIISKRPEGRHPNLFMQARNGGYSQWVPSSWEVNIMNSDESPIYRANLGIKVELVQESILTGKQHTQRRECDPLRAPDAGYGVWIPADEGDRDIKLSYKLIAVGDGEPKVRVEGVLNFAQTAGK